MKGGNTKQGNKGATAPGRLPSPFGPSSPLPSEFPYSFVREASCGGKGKGGLWIISGTIHIFLLSEQNG